jgi:hypothetical protein
MVKRALPDTARPAARRDRAPSARPPASELPPSPPRAVPVRSAPSVEDKIAETARPILDVAAIAELRGNHAPGLAEAVIAQGLSDWRSLIGDLETATARGEPRQILAFGEALAAAMARLGAVQAHEMLTALMERCRAGDMDAVRAMTRSVTAASDEARQALEVYLATTPPVKVKA